MAIRLQNELRSLNREMQYGCTTGIRDDNIYQWYATIQGPPGSPYEGGIFSIELDFPENYPFRPPKCKMTTKIYHPNISADGHICVDSLTHQWTPTMNVRTILQAINVLLCEPNPNDPLNQEAANLFKSDRTAFDAKARYFTKDFA